LWPSLDIVLEYLIHLPRRHHFLQYLNFTKEKGTTYTFGHVPLERTCTFVCAHINVHLYFNGLFGWSLDVKKLLWAMSCEIFLL
jgi:hypothetical protein